MTLRNLYLGYTITNKREFFEKREELRKMQPGLIVEAGLEEARRFDLRRMK
jgi:hypothetical protein